MLSAERMNVWNLTWVGMIKISRIPIGKSLSFFKVFFFDGASWACDIINHKAACYLFFPSRRLLGIGNSFKSMDIIFVSVPLIIHRTEESAITFENETIQNKAFQNLVFHPHYLVFKLGWEFRRKLKEFAVLKISFIKLIKFRTWKRSFSEYLVFKCLISFQTRMWIPWNLNNQTLTPNKIWALRAKKKYIPQLKFSCMTTFSYCTITLWKWQSCFIKQHLDQTLCIRV